MITCVGACVRTGEPSHVYRPEVDAGSLSGWLSALFSEAGSLPGI